MELAERVALPQSENTGKGIAALAKAIGAIGAVSKTGRNSHQKYDYHSVQDIKGAVQKPFADNGLAFVPLEIMSLEQATGSDRIDMVCRWRLFHSSGEWIDCQVASCGLDRAGKGVYIAATGSVKYALLGMCMIAGGDDAEHDDNQPTKKPRGKKASPKKAPSAVPPKQLTQKVLERSPDWEEAQRGFCAALGDMGLSYDQVAKVCEMMDRPRPSQMDGAQRGKLLDWMKTSQARTKMQDLGIVL